MKRAEVVLARRYAQAFLHVFKDQLKQVGVEKLPNLAQALSAQRMYLLYGPLLMGDSKTAEGLEKFCSAAGYAEIFNRMIRLLEQHGRLILLPAVLEKIYTGYLELTGVMQFVIETALPLETVERDQFVQFLARATDKEIWHSEKVVPSLIAGVRMYSATYGYEHSVRQRLEQLARSASY